MYLWDIRKAAGPLNSLDQHNGGGASNTASGIQTCTYIDILTDTHIHMYDRLLLQ